MIYTRRDFLKYSLATLGAVSALKNNIMAADNTPTPAELATMRQVAGAFMRDHSVPGLAVAIARHGQLIYDTAFGFADRDNQEKLTTNHLFRIASVTKPITSVAIFTLIEQGRLTLEDLVFGPGGLLRGDFGDPPYKQYVGQLRVKHLLTHTGGGWSNEANDPMFLHQEMNHKQLITWTLNNLPLSNPPGQHYAYSNFGYCILGRVIEKLTGKPYENFIKEAILNKCGISDMRIGGNTLAEKFPREVMYYEQQGDASPYSMNVRRMDSHGGWLATASDMVKFAVHVDGQSAARNILKPASIKEMTTPTIVAPDYAKGWAVNNIPNWWHTGALPGTTTIMVRTGSNYCWSALANTRELKTDTGGAIDTMMWNMVKSVKNWDA